MRRLVTCFLASAGILFALTCSAATPQRDVQRRVQDKVKQVEATFPKWVQAGGNPRALEPLTQELDRHMKAGRLAEARRILPEILAIWRNDKPAPGLASNETVVERVQRKSKAFDSKAPLCSQARRSEPYPSVG